MYGAEGQIVPVLPQIGLIIPNWQKDFTNYGMIFMLIMMRASRNIIHKRLEATVEAN